ncbi:MAG TPA: copper resistance protein CopC [Gaiellaceae bacterium]|nr:copper resistance protein CopC [Gaiellaceae bacterium]
MRRSTGIAVAAVVAALVLPAAASAHAYLTHTVPQASVTLNSPPPDVELTFDEAVEPRFAIISVTDAEGRSVTSGPLFRSPSNPDTLIVPLKRVPEGWYLVYWRAISVDGHPVQSAFQFAVGPNAGPVPQFNVPHINGTATTTPLLIARWLMFLTVMSAIGLFVLRMLIARPMVRLVEGTTLRALSIGCVVAAVLGLVATPIYIEEATAIDSVRSFFAFGTLVPLWRTTEAGRGYVDFWICFALFVGAALVALWADRPEQPRRSVASLLSLSGALAAAAATLVLPGTTGHAGQTAPRGLAVAFDWLHLVSSSLWIGGLLGLVVVWRSLPVAKRVGGLIVTVPRFSNVAFVSVLVLFSSGVGASVLHLPVLSALWQTSYGKVIILKAGLLLATMPLAATNLLRTKPNLVRSVQRAELGEPAARLLRGLVAGEALIVAGAVFAAALLSSLAPPPPAFALESSAQAHVGPGRVAETVTRNGYTVQLLIDPNKAVAENSFGVKLTRNGAPVSHAQVTIQFNMLDMEMPQQEYGLAETSPGVYTRKASALVMVGHWGLNVNVTPPGAPAFSALIDDRAAG